MKTILSLFLLGAVALAGCCTNRPTADARANSETVLVTYHVQAGKAAEFQAVLARSWELYRKNHLVYARPHIVVRDTEGQDKPQFIEIFTWVNKATPQNAPEEVKDLWQQEQSLCEDRYGHRGIEPDEVTLVHRRPQQ